MVEWLKPKPEVVILLLENSLTVVCLQRVKMLPLCRSVQAYLKFCVNRNFLMVFLMHICPGSKIASSGTILVSENTCLVFF